MYLMEFLVVKQIDIDNQVESPVKTKVCVAPDAIVLFEGYGEKYTAITLTNDVSFLVVGHIDTLIELYKTHMAHLDGAVQ